MLRPVHQYHSVISERDGVGNNVLAMQKMFRGMGHQSEVFYDVCSESLKDHLHPWDCYEEFSGPETVLIVHYTLDHPNLTALHRLPDKIVFSYHNITPSRFFEWISSQVAEECRRGRNRLPSFKDRVACAVGSNDFNLAELKRAGFRQNFRVPELIDFELYHTSPNPTIATDLIRDDTVTWLFVGRMLPHKRHDDVIRTFFYYQKYINSRSRLILVGGFPDEMLIYEDYLRRLTSRLGVSGVKFAGSVSQEDLMAFYQGSDLLLCMSEHEGLCIPLIESMVSSLPIIAYDSSAVGETLGAGGILVREKRFPEIAELAHYLISHSKLKADLATHQKERLKDFSEDKVRKGWQEVLAYVGSL